MLRLIVDLETDGLLDTVSKIHCMVVKDIDKGEVSKFRPDEIQEGLSYVSKADVLYGHNIIAYDLPVIKKLYPEFRLKENCRIIDTLVYSRLCYGNLADLDFIALNRRKFTKEEFVTWSAFSQKYVSAIGSHSLAAWGLRLGNLKGDYGKEENAWESFSEEMLEYCVQDIEVTHSLINKLEAREFPEDAIDLEMAVAEIIFRQEKHGWFFDVEAAQSLYAKLCGIRSKLEVELKEVFPGWYEEMKTPEYYSLETEGYKFREESKTTLEDTAYYYLRDVAHVKVTRGKLKELVVSGPLKQRHTAFNPGSRQHIHRALKERYNWVPKEFTETGEAKVDETILESLDYPEAKLLSQYFMIQKRIGQIAEGDQSWLSAEKEGRIHGRCNTLGAVTGRATHQHPNLAQVPAGKKPYGTECRSLFTVPKGYKMVGSDAEGQELRCLAHYLYRYDGGKFADSVVSGDKDAGTDVHTMNMKAAGLATRDQAKTFIYAFLYGAGDAKIGSIVIPKGTEEEQKKAGRKLKKQFLDATPALRRLREDIVEEAEENEWILALDGRRIPIRSSHAALNSLLQGAGAILTKRWMKIIDDLIKEEGLSPYVFQLGWIHDELQFEVKEGYEEKLADICKRAMRLTERYYMFNCPLAAGTAIGDNWNDTH